MFQHEEIGRGTGGDRLDETITQTLSLIDVIKQITQISEIGSALIGIGMWIAPDCHSHISTKGLAETAVGALDQLGIGCANRSVGENLETDVIPHESYLTKRAFL